MENWNYDSELIRAKTKESYYRKKMEHYQEVVKMIEDKIKEQETNKLKDKENDKKM